MKQLCTPQSTMAKLLADWYEEHGRHTLPWRQTQDPWALLVSEVMLQQTQVDRVLLRWEAFLTQWPTPERCSSSPLEEILKFWQGLGYPRRAKWLWESAAYLSTHPLPEDESTWLQLNGVGPYTARAMLALTHPSSTGNTPPVDVNIRRVLCRSMFGTYFPTPPNREYEEGYRNFTAHTLDAKHQMYAFFDLGATICTARAPKCSFCPLQSTCTFTNEPHGMMRTYPIRKRSVPYKHSIRQIRGALLKCLLEAPTLHDATLHASVSTSLGWEPTDEVLQIAHTALIKEGLLPEPFGKMNAQ